MRRLWVLIKIGIGFVFLINGAAWALYANPEPFFEHSYSGHGLTWSAVDPIDEASADQALAKAAMILADSPLGAPERSYKAFDTNNSWRTKLFFASVPKAGGVTYYPFAKREAYLSGADVASDVLIKDAYRVTPPRTLTYYLVHEFTHLRIGELTGPIEYHRLPKWIMEGICDVVALGMMDEAEIAQMFTWDGTPLERMQSHGSYPIERALVSFAHLHLGLSPRDLISEPMDRSDVMDLMKSTGIKGAL